MPAKPDRGLGLCWLRYDLKALVAERTDGGVMDGCIQLSELCRRRTCGIGHEDAAHRR
jgi:hypothetical protein